MAVKFSNVSYSPSHERAVTNSDLTHLTHLRTAKVFQCNAAQHARNGKIR